MLAFMRVAACTALALLILGAYAEWNFLDFLAPEAVRYQADYPDALRSGLSGSYALGHLLLSCGFMAAVVGVVLVCCKKRSGLPPLVVAAPAIAVGAWLFEPMAAYPSLEPTYLVILWCGASAAWASAVTLAFLSLKS